MVRQYDHMKATGTLSVTSVEMEWLGALERDAREIASAFAIPPVMHYEDIKNLQEDLHLLESNQPIYEWSISVEMHNRLRYLFHLACIRPVFPRKIRKCHLRKAIQRYQREKKRAQRRYGL